VQTPTLIRAPLEAPAHPDPEPLQPSPAPDSRDDRPPGFGKWPWWTPFGALAAALLAMAGPVLLLESADFPFLATVGEGLFGVALLGFAFLFMSRFGGRPRPGDLGLRATPSRAAVGWVVVARIAFGILAVIYISAVGGVTSNAPIRPVGGVEELDALDVAIAVVVLAPLVEEVFFRGFMYGSLRGKLPVFWAALVTGAVFAAIHPLFGAANWNLVPVLALAGVAMCLLYERTGSIWPAIAFHFVMNVGILTIVTGSATLALSLVGGAALLFLLAPWRFFRRGRGSGQRAPATALTS
jgi:membrane protease YdiL (CAAX protease family)